MWESIAVPGPWHVPTMFPYPELPSSVVQCRSSAPSCGLFVTWVMVVFLHIQALESASLLSIRFMRKGPEGRTFLWLTSFGCFPEFLSQVFSGPWYFPDILGIFWCLILSVARQTGFWLFVSLSLSSSLFPSTPTI